MSKIPLLVPGIQTVEATGRLAALLRLLGRLEFVPMHHIHALIYPDMTRYGALKALHRAHKQRLIWRSQVQPEKVPGAIKSRNAMPPPCLPYVYGLTPEGRALLGQMEAEENPNDLDTFVVRDWKKPDVRATQLAHDLLVVNWCCLALRHSRHHPGVRSIRCQLEYVSATTVNGQPMQRFDALMMVELGESTVNPLMPYAIPWGHPSSGPQQTVAWAIEVDRGTEKLVTLLGKAVMYRDLTVSGHYAATLGVNPLPVVLAPNARRSAQIAREWLDGWPQGRGVIAPFAAAAASEHGVLWGRYKTLGENPARNTTLWEDVGLSREAWDLGCEDVDSTHEVWALGAVLPAQRLPMR